MPAVARKKNSEFLISASVVIAPEKGKVVPSLASRLIRTRSEVAGILSIKRTADGKIILEALMRNRASLSQVVSSMGFAVLDLETA